jgi:hypothetical protein
VFAAATLTMWVRGLGQVLHPETDLLESGYVAGRNWPKRAYIASRIGLTSPRKHQQHSFHTDLRFAVVGHHYCPPFFWVLRAALDNHRGRFPDYISTSYVAVLISELESAKLH